MQACKWSESILYVTGAKNMLLCYDLLLNITHLLIYLILLVTYTIWESTFSSKKSPVTDSLRICNKNSRPIHFRWGMSLLFYSNSRNSTSLFFHQELLFSFLYTGINDMQTEHVKRLKVGYDAFLCICRKQKPQPLLSNIYRQYTGTL